MPNLRAPYQPAAQRSAAPPAADRIDSEDMRSALSTPVPSAAVAPGMPNMTPQLQAQMDMMKNNPDMMKQSMEMMKNMDPDMMAKMLESQSAMTGMKVTPEMAKMSANMMKNMDPAQMEKMMSMAGSMGMGGGMPGMGGAHAGAAGGAGAVMGDAAAQRGVAPGGEAGGMAAMQMDPATGMPIVTPELQKQMSSMMRDPEMRKNMSNMMKNLDPEMMKSMGITDKAQIEKAAQVMENMSPEQVDRLMGFAVWGQKAYIFYKTHLWFRCVLQLSLMYMLYWMFGGWTMRAIGFFTGSSSATAAAPDTGAAGAGGKVNAGEGAGERDWSGKASAPIMDDDEDEDVLSAPETKHGRAGAAKQPVGRASSVVSDDDEEL